MHYSNKECEQQVWGKKGTKIDQIFIEFWLGLCTFYTMVCQLTDLQWCLPQLHVLYFSFYVCSCINNVDCLFVQFIWSLRVILGTCRSLYWAKFIRSERTHRTKRAPIKLMSGHNAESVAKEQAIKNLHHSVGLFITSKGNLFLACNTA